MKYEQISAKLRIIFCLSFFLTGCAGYPRVLNFTFDPQGRGLNSLTSELTPQVTSRYIVFVSDRNGSQDIYLYNAKERRLIDLPGLNSLDEIASDPSISADGRYIAFVASRQGRADIYFYDRNIQQKRNLTADILTEVRNPTISGDGSLIAFEVANNGQWDIQVYTRAGEPLELP